MSGPESEPPAVGSAWRDLLCGEVRPEHVGRRLRLAGWADTRRDHGGLVFIDLRDRTGLCQIVVNPERAPVAMEAAHATRNEFVLQAEGEVVPRAPEAVNPNLPTGEVELQVDRLEILSRCPPLPFQLDEEDVDETLRLRYRWLDLRRPRLQRNIAMRAKSSPSSGARWRPPASSTSRRRSSSSRPPRERATSSCRAVCTTAASCASSVPADPEAAVHGRRLRPLLPDRDLLPRRGSACRSCPGDHPARRRAGVSRPGVSLLPDRDDDGGDLARVRRRRAGGAVRAADLRGGGSALRLRQAGPSAELELEDATAVTRESRFGVFAGAETVRFLRVPQAFSRSELAGLEERAKEWGAKGLAYLVYDESARSAPRSPSSSPSRSSGTSGVTRAPPSCSPPTRGR